MRVVAVAVVTVLLAVRVVLVVEVKVVVIAHILVPIMVVWPQAVAEAAEAAATMLQEMALLAVLE
jgi:hypothetical protein